MNRIDTSGLALFALLAFTPSALAQGQVHVVDDDGGPGVSFTDIPAAVLGAASGDTLLVKDGTYSGFVIASKSLTVLAEIPRRVDVNGRIFVRHLDPGETVVLRGLDTGTPDKDGLAVKFNDGHVRIEDCILLASKGTVGSGAATQGWPAVLVEDSDDVVIVRSTGTGGDGAQYYDWNQIPGTGGQGLEVIGSNVALYDSHFQGGNGGSDWGGIAGYGGWGGRGGDVQSGLVYAIGTVLEGGRGGSGGTAWEWKGCANGAPGGPGLHVSGGEVQARDATTTGGPGGFGVSKYGCSNGPAGPDMQTPGGTYVANPGSAKGFIAPAPLRVQTLEQLTFTGAPGDVVFATFSTPGTGFLPVPAWSGVLVTDLLGVSFVAGIVPGSGSLTVPVSLAGVPGGTQSLLMHGQSIYADLSGQVVLGAYSSLVVLAAGF